MCTMEADLKFEHFFLCVLKSNVGFQVWNSQNACQNKKKGKTLIRLLLSDLGLHCFSRPFWQATSARNFRTFTILIIFTFSLLGP